MDDELWDPDLEETFPRFRARGRNILDRIFASENAAVKRKRPIGLIAVLDYLFVTSCFYHCPPRMECNDHGSVGIPRIYGSL